MSSILSRACKGVLCLSAILGSNFALAQVANGSGELHYDARIPLTEPLSFQAQSARGLAPPAMSGRAVANIQEMSVEMDSLTGAVSSMSSQTGFLTDARAGRPMDIAMEFIRANAESLGLQAGDLDGYRVRDVVTSSITGNVHIYLQQRVRGMDVYNAQIGINVSRDGRIISVNNSFMPGVAKALGGTTRALVSMPAAVDEAMKFAGVSLQSRPRVLSLGDGFSQTTRVSNERISLDPIVGNLMVLPIRPGEARLVWNFQIATLDKQNMWDLTVDAQTGQVWTRNSWMAADQYRVYPQPVESPNHTSPLPPADARVLAVNPANAVASPFGWHDTNGAAGAESTLTIGNNVSAYTDVDANNAPDAGSQPSGGAALNFDFPLDLTLAPSSYRPAAVTNLFYLNNIMHDIQYQYGFNEVAGNFQVNNYGRGGAGNDSVRAEAQDGSGTNNANFGTPPDGQAPRMQMFLWTNPNPDRDGDIDASIVFHEYGHGISNRLVGGPSNASCLTNAQQPGEGLSDWWALVYTAKQGDTGPDGRGIGTYSLGQPTSGLGVRTQRYSTDPAINTFTYQSINGAARPHGVGQVWAQAAWEVYWKLVDRWGFSPNLYNATGGAGNQRAMLYVNEGLKNTACNPTFTQVRDGIIQAATTLNNGEDVCTIWAGFAGVGLGVDAVSGGANSTAPTNGFNVPASCQGGGGGQTVVFADDFETDKGWVTNASNTDTATTGAWQRANPDATNSGGVKQVGTTTSGVNALVTGAAAGAAAGTNDVDGGVTSIRSPAITLPATGTLTLTFNQYLAFANNATSADFLRVTIQGSSSSAVVFQRVASATNVNGAYAAATANLTPFAGQTIRILVEAADAATASLIEASIDDVRITQQ